MGDLGILSATDVKRIEKEFWEKADFSKVQESLSRFLEKPLKFLLDKLEMNTKTDDLMVLVDIGVKKMMEEIVDYVTTVSNDHHNQVNLVTNILLNTACNIFKNASETPESLNEKIDTHIKHLLRWKERVLKDWDNHGRIRENLTTLDY